MATMRAIQMTEFGGPEVLALAELPVPEAGEGEVLIEVSRAGVNFGDTHTSNLQNPVHDYMAPGSFQVTLTACNAGGCSTVSQIVTVPGP